MAWAAGLSQELPGGGGCDSLGVAGFRIDLGVRHPDYPHGYLLGVECDGRAYHSALSVRDRDRLREAVLRDLGWDIYRIWSTDWFEDADRELKKLMQHVAGRLEAIRAGLGAEDGETVLLGETVERSEEQPVGASPSQHGPEELDDEPLYVEVGDTVSYHEAGRGLDIRRVTIVRGKDDPAKAIINDNKPLAVALLGAEVGETVTVRQPTSELDIVVDRIERPEREVGEGKVAGASTSVDGVELAPYQEWRGHAVDPRRASQGEAVEILCAIIETEGSVLENRAYQIFVRASGIQRLGPQIRRILNRALAKLERDGRGVVDRPVPVSPRPRPADPRRQPCPQPRSLLRPRSGRSRPSPSRAAIPEVEKSLCRASARRGERERPFRRMPGRSQRRRSCSTSTTTPTSRPRPRPTC